MKIKIALTDERIYPEAVRRLQLLGFHVLTLPPHPALPAPLASHTDMLIARVGGEWITVGDYCDTAPHIFTDLSLYLRGARFSFTSDTLGNKYPEDSRLNVLSFGSLLFCKRDTVSPYILERAEKSGMKIISVKQGYPACTVLKLTDEAAITADSGMAYALRKNGIKVYEIEDGGIELPPYSYGFIGGAAGVFNGCVYFTGCIRSHPSYSVIREACEAEGLIIRELSDLRPLDVGGIIFAEGDV